MTALANGVSRDILYPGPSVETYLAAAGQIFKQGSMVGVDTADGLLKVVTASTTLKIVGCSCVDKNTTGLAEDDRYIPVEHGIIGWFSVGAGGDAINSPNHLKQDCYGIDDDTVGLTSGTNTRSKAGKVHSFKDGLVAVQFEVVIV